MAENIATHPQPSLSLPIRLEKKRKRLQVGVASVTLGVVLLGAAAYNSTYSGSMLIAIYLTIASVCALVAGIIQLRRALG